MHAVCTSSCQGILIVFCSVQACALIHHPGVFDFLAPQQQATLDPDAHPETATLLQHVGYFDCVDDESGPDRLIVRTAGDSGVALTPDEYTKPEDPPYSCVLAICR